MTIDPFDVAEAPFGEPASIAIDHALQWQRDIDIDPDLFSLSYKFRPHDGGKYSGVIIAMSNVAGSHWAVDVSPGDIEDMTAGSYHWDLVVLRISDSRTKIIDTGEVEIFTTDTDRRSHAQVMIRKIESILERRADNDVASYTIKSRSITKMGVDELREWRDYYRRELDDVAALNGAFEKSGPNPSTLRVRFI